MGQRLVSLAFPGRSAPWLLPGTKSVSYATHVAAEAEAKRRGADDAVLVDHDGTVLEGTVTNVWWREGDVLVTPALELGILAGETRAALLALAARARATTVETGAFPLARLLDADEVFTSSSVREVMPVVARRRRARTTAAAQRTRYRRALRRLAGGLSAVEAGRRSRAPSAAARGDRLATLPAWRSSASAAWPSRTASSSTARPPGAPPSGCPTGRSRRRPAEAAPFAGGVRCRSFEARFGSRSRSPSSPR